MSLMPSCKHITEHSSEYLDKSLPLGKRLRMQLHLFMCVNCRRYLRHMKLTIATLARIHVDEQDTTTAPATVEQVARILIQEGRKSHTSHNG